jgi:hypothetical protein
MVPDPREQGIEQRGLAEGLKEEREDAEAITRLLDCFETIEYYRNSYENETVGRPRRY